MLGRTVAAVGLAATIFCESGVAQTGRVVAVLPFENVGSYGRDKDEFDALRRGLAATLASELAGAGGQIVGREQVQKLVEAEVSSATERVDLATAARIGRALGARYVVAASFTDLYGDFRVDANIIDVESGAVVKVVRSDPKLTDQRQMYRIVQSVAERVRVSIQLGAERTVPATPNVPSDALLAFSRALLHRDRGERQKAIEQLNRALRVLPDYPLAQAELRRLQGG